MQTKKIHPKSEDKMAKVRIREEGLEPSPFYKETDTPSKQSMKNRFFSYKFGLVIHDLIIVLLVFGLGGQITNFNFNMKGDISQAVILFILFHITYAGYI